MRLNKITNKVFILLLLCTSAAYGQKNVDQTVFVESTFKPRVEEAEKISSIPLATDTAQVTPEISYSVLPSRIDAQYKIKSIKPAKLVGSPLDKLYNSRVRLGIGNYTTPLLEFSIQNLRSKEYAVGAYAYHKSSHAKLKLENGHKVPAGYGTNKFAVYGKRFYNDFNVEGEVGFNSQKNRFYGYNTANFPDTVPDMESKEIRQWYSQIKARAEIYSTNTDSLALQYRLALIADYFSDDYANSQNHVDVPGKVSFMIKDFRLDLNARFHYFASTLDTLRGVNDNAFQFNPVLSKRGDQWQVRVGLNTYFTSYGDANIYPEAELCFDVIPGAMQAYFGVNGDLELNHFSKIANENYFILPGLNMKNTNHKLIGYGGVKGLISSDFGYKAELRFDSMEDIYFFQNDTNSILENQFVPVYDNADLLKVMGELWYSPYTYLDFYLKGAYNSYSLATELKAWHKPTSEFTFRTVYNYKEKIYATFDLINIGKRYTKDFSDLTTPKEHKAIWDVNLALEYKYSNVLSGFVNAHNILGQRYDIWNQYPSQKINVMLGLSYKF